MAQIQWHWHTFTELSHATLYDILKLRQDVFILEQQCFYPDMDSQDQAALHLTGHADGKLVAYIRLLSKQKHGQPIITISRVIKESTLSFKQPSPRRPSSRTMSRSDRMPAADPPSFVTTTAPMRFSETGEFSD